MRAPDTHTRRGFTSAAHAHGRTPISPKRDWREVQANRGMAALLMPGRTFKDVVRRPSSRSFPELAKALGVAPWALARLPGQG